MIALIYYMAWNQEYWKKNIDLVSPSYYREAVQAEDLPRMHLATRDRVMAPIRVDTRLEPAPG